jgi:hypothetical protein
MRLTFILFAGIIAGVARGSAPVSAKTAKECNAEYAANKAAIQAAKQRKKDFIAACRAGTETIPGGAAAAPAPAPQPTTAPAPAPAPAPTTTAAPSAPTTPTAANQFQTEQQAQGRCFGQTVVWVNTRSHIYHFAGTRDYGHTKQGAYMCEADATAAGNRAAKNEKHP